LTDDNLKVIIRNNIEEYKKYLLDKFNITVEYTDEVVDYVLNFIEDEKEFGARPIVRAIETEMIDKISDAILNNDESITECVFTVDENDKLQMRTVLANA
jgi:ATP-dependent Clp protease ATP-binding subunit ClpA